MATSIELTPEIDERLDRLAANNGRTKDEYLRAMVEKVLEDIEDLYDAEQATLARLAGKDEPISLEELMKEYGLGN
jgi:RHH-type rel operon transcriptional repressor/antitoxin RelB